MSFGTNRAGIIELSRISVDRYIKGWKTNPVTHAIRFNFVPEDPYMAIISTYGNAKVRREYKLVFRVGHVLFIRPCKPGKIDIKLRYMTNIRNRT